MVRVRLVEIKSSLEARFQGRSLSLQVYVSEDKGVAVLPVGRFRQDELERGVKSL
jgi:hypothetical protein